MTFCSNCGMELTEGTAFCPNCGAGQVRQCDAPEQPVPAAEPEVFTPAPVYQEAAPEYQPVYQQNVEAPAATLTGPAKILSIISMICGLVSLVSCYAGFVPAIAALVLSNIACKKAPGVPNSKANIGKITGIIGIVVSALCFIGYIILVAVGTFAGMESSYYY